MKHKIKPRSRSSRAGHSPRKRRRYPRPRSADQLFAAPEPRRERWIKTTQVISKMRSEKKSLSAVARELNIDPRTVARMAGSSLRKRSNGRYAATGRDSLLRVLTVPGPTGPEEVAVRDSRYASALGQYASGARKFLATGDDAALRKAVARSRKLKLRDASGARIHLISDLELLERLGSAGVLSFESLYARSA